MPSPRRLSELQLAAASEAIEARIGMHFPRDRWVDLDRRLRDAARALGDSSANECVDRLLAGALDDEQFETLLSAITIGETYFFRDGAILQQIEEQILPPLIAARRTGDRRLRLWSAGCSTGEEPYTLAMLMHRLLPDLANWQLTILATDLNPRSLRRAEEGIYGEWSFRGAPRGLKQRYFEPLEDGRFRVRDEIRSMVTFARFNLADDGFTSVAGPSGSMDLIFCRNVLMYFHHSLIERAIQKFCGALADGGWLIVSPSESPLLHNSPLTPVLLPKTVLYCKNPVEAGIGTPAVAAVLPSSAAVVPPPSRSQSHHRPRATDGAAPRVPHGRDPHTFVRRMLTRAEHQLQQGRYEEATAALRELYADDRNKDARLRGWTAGLLARAAANTGQLDEAASWIEKALGLDPRNPELHYLDATVATELGRLDDAEAALRRAITIKENFVLAHLSLANLSRRQRRFDEANHSYANVLALLRDYAHDEVLPYSDGMTAGRLSELATAMSQR